MMNEANQGNDLGAPAIFPVKRKRGRPRKYPRPDPEGGNGHVSRDQNRNREDNARGRPVIGVNVNQPHQIEPLTNANDAVVGQVVHGVIEAAFDAGYLLTVRVGNSETTLKGVVFKPGQYVPVSADNDVAPGAQMITRNEIPLPRENYSQVQGHNSRSRDRNGTGHMSHTANTASSKVKQLPQSAPLGESRGTFVPVVVQSVNLSNGVAASGEPSLVAEQASHQLTSEGKNILQTAHSSNGSTVIIQKLAVENQFPHFQSQNNQQTMLLQKEAHPFVPGLTEAQHEGEAKSMRETGMPFEKLLTEVINNVQVPSQSMETTSSSANKFSPKDSDHSMEDEDNDTDRALSIEPLQALQPHLPNHPLVVSRPIEQHYRAGKMTELLQVLQENMRENQASQNKQPTTSSIQERDELRTPETAQGE
ncbi:hypothetical protein K2173_011926 [Erythroxylum novogranatense]|uniref:AT hook motif-containing protein n=1 Tax=Erythroxylum novogranatense TaxID=1862640 RepID=A0AAV8TEL8_9ROSI|nr:hypothetical protein K2173_011926 [Erythroxylum novogranatense]